MEKYGHSRKRTVITFHLTDEDRWLSTTDYYTWAKEVGELVEKCETHFEPPRGTITTVTVEIPRWKRDITAKERDLIYSIRDYAPGTFDVKELDRR